ncbi:MAG: efflux RND transporter periplasmic adaptor subunit [Leptolyngbyaceae cyanobacterium MO_188.B28]|nr:efflux RND transporter periplasmic adaptor subunit [Leptolyngbyaceae cyanobacterium MO_188.B28]
MEAPESQATVVSQSSDSLPQSSQQNSWIWTMFALLLLAGGGALIWRQFNSGGPPQGFGPPQSVPVKIQRIETVEVKDSSEYVATLEAQERVSLRPEATGRVTQIFVTSGETVQPGDQIVQLSAERSQAELSAALANINAARAARDSAQAELRTAEAERARAAAEVNLQNEEIERSKYLVERGAQSQQTLDLIIRDRDTAIANLQADKERIQAAQASLAQANAALTQAEADSAAIREDLLDKTVVAPIAGMVGDIPVKLGDYVTEADILTTITQNQTLELELPVSEGDINQMEVGLPVELAQFGEETPLATGRISFISPQTNADSQATLVKALFANPNARLRDAQKVEASIIWSQQPGILIPTEAVSRLAGQTFVFVVESETQAESGETQQVARQKPVQLGDIHGNSYQVIEGLEPGEQLIVTGILNLTDGIPITPETAQSPATP